LKRSEINDSIDQAIGFFNNMDFSLPSFALWPPSDWRSKGPEYDEIRDCGLGWDVTDFGSGTLRQVGRTIFTLRNGRGSGQQYPKTYAQKVMYMQESQKSAVHYHRTKMEDIINQGGGNIIIVLWRVSSDSRCAHDPLELSVSGQRIVQPAGEPLRLTPGESICVVPGTYHQFWAEEGHGAVLSGEVSSVCDDSTDNFFLDGGERFPHIVEDEPARHVLCHEYEGL